MLVCMAFTLPIKLSLFQPMDFLAFTPPILFLIPLGVGGEWVSSCVGLSCQQGLIHDIYWMQKHILRKHGESVSERILFFLTFTII